MGFNVLSVVCAVSSEELLGGKEGEELRKSQAWLSHVAQLAK